MPRKAVTGKPINRLDGRLKVTGEATYAAEFDLPKVAYAFGIESQIAAGRVREIDTSAAEKAAGVLAVITHKNALKLAPAEAPTGQKTYTRVVAVLQDTRINFHGQFIGMVVAETYEQARHAAGLVKVVYDEEKPATKINENAANVKPERINAGYPNETKHGDVEAGLKLADATVEAIYKTPIEHHNPLETHAATAVWENNNLIVYTCTQNINSTQTTVSKTFQMQPEKVRIVSPHVGGGFGSKVPTRAHVILAAMAARMTNRPVKMALTRQQMFTNVCFRQANIQKLRLGATKDGKLTAIAHEVLTHTSMTDDFLEQTGVMARMMYETPNSLTAHRAARLHLQTGMIMRAPGEAPGSFALESSIDELAYKLKIDPIEFRVKNEPVKDPENGKEWSTRSLVECFRTGAEKFGWSRRKIEPRQNQQGNFLIGYGCASGTYPARQRPNSARVKLKFEKGMVGATVETAATDLGTGTYTIIAQTAADALGLPLEHISVLIGDSNLPPSSGSGGSFGAASAVNSVNDACLAARAQLEEKSAKLNLNFFAEPSIGDLMKALNLNEFEARTDSKQAEEVAKKYSIHTFAAHFAEVWVDKDLGTVRVPKFLTATAAGKILNPKTASSQIIGGVIWGISQALHEESQLDARYGKFINDDLANYHVPVNADIGTIETVFIREEDSNVNKLGVKGIGEVGIVGSGAAVANAIFNATGKRVRELPITPDKLL